MKGYTKMDFEEFGKEHVDWIPLAEDVDQWRAFVNEVMNLGFP
jgi:hypothetical protein